MTINRKDLATGAIFIIFGGVYGWIAYTSLPIGRAIAMGPGYFPVMLSGIMVLVGTAIGVRSLFIRQEAPFGRIPWRSVVMLSLATIFFAVTLRPLGMFPAACGTAMLACFATPQVGWAKTALIGVGLALFCTLVFVYGIRLNIPAFGYWLVR